MAAVESGTTTAVERRRLSAVALKTRQGRVLRISDPCVGSRLTHQTSPRCGTTASRPAGKVVVEALPLLDLGGQSGIGVGSVTRTLELALVGRELALEKLGDRGRAPAARHRREEPGREVIRQRQRDSHKS